MRLRTWAIGGAALLLLAAALIPARSHFGKKPAPVASAEDKTSSDGPKRDPKEVHHQRRVLIAPDGGRTVIASDGSPVQTSIPDLSSSIGSCVQDDGHGGQVCTDYFGTQTEIDNYKMRCRKTRRFASATWTDSPCDHAASHGGCWASHQQPARVRWFYGETHKDFTAGRDTYRICGAYSLAFKPDGTPVRVDGTAETGSPAPTGTAAPAAPSEEDNP